MESYFIWAHLLGFFAMCISIMAWQIKNPRHIILCYVPSGILWGTHYMLLGAPLGAIMNFCSAGKDSALAFIRKSYVPYLIIIFLSIVWIVGIHNFEYWYDILPLIGVSIINLSLLQRDKRSLVARATMGGQACWIIYNVIVGAWMGVACCLLVSTSSIIGMARHEKWEIGKCYRTFGPSLMRSLFLTPRTFP